MLADIIAGSRRLSGCALTLLLLFAACSCNSGSPNEWPVHRLYEGNSRPLNEVAIVFAKWGVEVLGADGNYVIPSLIELKAMDPSGYPDTEEFHLLPGQHDIRAIYWRTVSTGGTGYLDQEAETFTHDFNAGVVYMLWTPYGHHTLNIGTLGSIDEVACSTMCNPPKPGSAILAAVALGRSAYAAPAHWTELRRLRCPEKVNRRGQ